METLCLEMAEEVFLQAMSKQFPFLDILAFILYLFNRLLY
jgi:hypothetical protein